jgi:hypothetical protein
VPRSLFASFALGVVLAGCAEVPPLETPDEVEAIRAEWEAEAGVQPDGDAEADEAAPTEAGTEEDDYVIDVPPPYPSEVPAPPGGRRGDPDGLDGDEASEDEPNADSSVVRIPGTSRERGPRTLYEASQAAKERRKDAPKARIAITDDNLHEYQEGNITIGGSEGDAAGETGAETDAAAAAGERAREEEYWRSTVRDLRLRLRAVVDELAELEGRASDLRRSFYAQDDPYVRDGEIKPAWDRTLDRMEEARREILDLTRQLDTTLREGRRAGALPGWLREASDLEPAPDELPEDLRSEVRRTHEPAEPRVIEIEEDEPPDV